MRENARTYVSLCEDCNAGTCEGLGSKAKVQFRVYNNACAHVCACIDF